VQFCNPALALKFEHLIKKFARAWVMETSSREDRSVCPSTRFGKVNRRSRTYSGPLSRKEQILQRLRYRFFPPKHPFLNPFQQIVWRGQRLVLGDNRRRKDERH
jgi:hypothetical protein